MFQLGFLTMHHPQIANELAEFTEELTKREREGELTAQMHSLVNELISVQLLDITIYY